MEDKAKEAYFRDSLSSIENGNTEVSCIVGRVDVLTETEVIEVKFYKGWKEALGQALSYVLFFPNKSPRVHLIIPKEFKVPTPVLKCFEHYNVKLTTEEEIYNCVTKNYIYIIRDKTFKNVEEIKEYIQNILSLKQLQEKDSLFILELVNSAHWIKEKVDRVRIKINYRNTAYNYFEIYLKDKWKPISYSNYLQDTVLKEFLNEDLNTEEEFTNLITIHNAANY